MKFDLGAFAAGFATKATEIEEESAKIGMNLINEAIEDFRQESKDWKNQYDEEMGEWEQLAGLVNEMVGGDDARTIAVLRKGKAFTSDFINNARTRASELGLGGPKDLIDFGDATLPKNITVEDWVRSGAPDLSLPAKPFLDTEQFNEFRTGVFGRQISPEAEGRVERTTETFLTPSEEATASVGTVPGVDIDLYGTRQVPGVFSSSEEERFRKAVLSTLASRSSSVGGVSFDVAGNPNYQIDNAEAIADVERDADRIMERIISMRASAESEEVAPTVNDARDLARQFASSDEESIASRYDLGRSSTQTPPPPPLPAPTPSPTSTSTNTQQITQSVTSNQQYQNIVNPPSSAPRVSKLQRRANLVAYLTGIGVPQQDAVTHAQQVIQ